MADARRVPGAALVRRLIDAQFPEWGALRLAPVLPGGWDHATFRLGEPFSVRLPTAARYAAQVEKEQRWVPRLAPQLPLPIPEPIALGRPGEGYPWHWSVNRWLAGESAERGSIADLAELAAALAAFLCALQRAPCEGGPPPGPHCFFRGGPLAVYDAQTRAALAALAGEIDSRAALALWDQALGAPASGPPVWVHGDVSAGNVLLRGGRLCAVLDFGCAAVGDPACDLAIAWTLFDAPSRAVFRSALGIDAACWARGRGWALWKAVIELAADPGAASPRGPLARRTLGELFAEHDS